MWFLRHVLGLLGALTLLPTVVRLGKAAVGLGGDVDFIISRSNDPGWIRQAVNWLFHPPDWAIAPLIILGLMLIWADVKRPWKRLKSGPTTLLIECYRTKFPMVLPASGRLHSLNLERREKVRSVEMGEQVGAPGDPISWPFTRDCYRIEITNLGAGAIFDVAMSFPAKFAEITTEKEGRVSKPNEVAFSGDWTIHIPTIFPGKENTFALFVYSHGKHFVSTTLPDAATFLVAGSNRRYHAKLLKPGNKDIDIWPQVLIPQEPETDRFVAAAPAIPIDEMSLRAYVRSSPLIKELDRAIAKDLAVVVDKDAEPTHIYEEEARAFKIRTIAELDALLRTHKWETVRVAHHMPVAGPKMSARYCLMCLFSQF
jgi:hypothetical protein